MDHDRGMTDVAYCFVKYMRNFDNKNRVGLGAFVALYFTILGRLVWSIDGIYVQVTNV